MGGLVAGKVCIKYERTLLYTSSMLGISGGGDVRDGPISITPLKDVLDDAFN